MFEALEVHLKRLDTAKSAWLGQLIKADKDIDYHGNIISSFVGRDNLTEDDRKVVESSWTEVSKANQRQQVAERRLREVEIQRQELIDLASISKAKEFMRGVNR
jgi:hypothetical protein